ncbi:hypothetical protein V2A60_001690 [Cordyceps javanica]|uniref:Uncharacterized protein n=1 Tax=Cordyceps javanica TaxID=43265 RepID=A0A545WCY7_9HYPO|nr:hypothetical protein IF1G_00555 [Cordyceps javanica]TQW11802.1 transmembrane alpha-helix domain-containing protein [Cordyceps javanica]
MAATPAPGIATIDAGPLTSIDTASICSQAALYSQFKEVVRNAKTTTSFELRHNFANIYRVNSQSSGTCVPTGYFEAVLSGSRPVFSASACPDGYLPKCTFLPSGATLTPAPPFRYWPPLASEDVAIGCCPSGYACADDIGEYSCSSTLASGVTTSVILLQNFTRSTTLTVNAETTVSAYALKLLYATKQADITPTATSTGGAATDTSQPGGDGRARGGLSVGQTAAIGVCVPLVVLASLAGLVFFLLRRRRRRRGTVARNGLDGDNDKAAAGGPVDGHPTSPELDGTIIKGHFGIDAAAGAAAELPGSEKQPQQQQQQQQTAAHEIVELPGCDVALLSPSPAPAR